ncbi:hypothetical protein Tco_0493899 [Tanacetum coccineum]
MVVTPQLWDLLLDLHWTAVKNILKYLRNTEDMFLVYGGDIKRELRVSCYTDAGYLTDVDDLKSQTRYVFVLNGGVVDWKSTKQSIFATSSVEAEYITAYDASNEAVWIKKFIYGLGVVPTIEEPITMYCDNTRAITIANESAITKGARHYHAKVHFLCEVIELGDIKYDGNFGFIFNEEGSKKLRDNKGVGSYTNTMFLESWGRSSYAREMVKVKADKELIEELVVAIPKLEKEGYTQETIHIEYEWKPPGFCLVKRRENNGNFKSFVKHKSKFEYKPRFSDVAAVSKQVNVQKEASSLTRGSIPLLNPFDLLNTDVDNVLDKGKKVVNTYATDHVNISVSIDEEDEDDVENVFDETICFITNTNHNVTKNYIQYIYLNTGARDGIRRLMGIYVRKWGTTCSEWLIKMLKTPFRKLLYEHGNHYDHVTKLRMELNEVQIAIDRDPSNFFLRDEEVSISHLWQVIMEEHRVSMEAYKKVYQETVRFEQMMEIVQQSMEMDIWEINEKLAERREQMGIRAYDEDNGHEKWNQKI